MIDQLSHSPAPKTGLRWTGIIGALLSLVLLGGAAAWAQLTEIKGAVIATGQVVVRGKPKSIQHLDGGLVDEIKVQDGDKVEGGQLLIKLDSTLLEANLDIYKHRLADALALRDRLIAEQLGSDKIVSKFPKHLISEDLTSNARIGQQAIFQSRKDFRNGRIAQLVEKKEQFSNQITGTETLIEAKEEQLALIDRELKSMRVLKKKKLMSDSQLMAIQRTRADFLGQIGEHRYEIARIKNSIRDSELEILQVERQLREESVTSLREVEVKIGELSQQIISTTKQLNRINIRSPVAGIVHELQVVTIGGVVPPGATILQLIPIDEGVTFDTNIEPAAIDQVYLGQPAKVTLSAFNQRTTPALMGKVENISPDIVTDENSGQSFYRVRIAVSKTEISRLGGLNIIPGMPVEAFMQTQNRTVLSYLSRPLTDQLNRTFREE